MVYSKTYRTAEVVHNCANCLMNKNNIQLQRMAAKIPTQMNPAFPFQHVGIDYCGTFMVTS